MVSHIGTIKGGHYVAHVKEGQIWWRVDDQGSPTVTASSIARMNSDTGGKTGKSAKLQSHPFLLSWVKVKEDIVTPTKAQVKTPTTPLSKEGKEPNDGTQGEKNNGAGGEEEPGASLSGGQAPGMVTGKPQSRKHLPNQLCRTTRTATSQNLQQRKENVRSGSS